MKFLVERDSLTEAVNWVARSLSVRPLQTSLLGIVINVDDEINKFLIIMEEIKNLL